MRARALTTIVLMTTCLVGVGGIAAAAESSTDDGASAGTVYGNKAASANTVDGELTQYSAPAEAPAPGDVPSASGQPATADESGNVFTNVQSSVSSLLGGFVKQG